MRSERVESTSYIQADARYLRNEFDCQVEEAGIREVVLPSMYPDAGEWQSGPVMICGLIFGQDMNYQGSTCICRVPKGQLRPGTIVECTHCGERLLRLSG